MIRPAPPADIDLTIGELVLDGFSASDARLVAAALDVELRRLLAEGPPLFHAGHPSGARRDMAFERADGGTVAQAENGSPGALGRSAARAVVRALRQLPAGGDARAGGPDRP